MSLHEGHRQRVREKFLQGGFDVFSDHEILELLLFYCIPRRDTNELAHKLINRFGSVEKVLNAPCEELEQIEGISAGVSAYFRLIVETHKYLSLAHASKNVFLKNVEQTCDYIKNYFIGEKNEAVYLLCLDAKRAVIGCYKIGEGSVTSTNVSTRTIVNKAISTNAVSVILAHNHPGGFAIPSPDDITTTMNIADALRSVEVILADHIIIADDDVISMRQSGVFALNER